MMNQFGVVILNKYPELAQHLLSSIKRFHINPPPVLVVCDRHAEDFMEYGLWVRQISVYDDFIYARNLNAGIRYMGIDLDIIAVNDDTEVVDEEFFYRLASIAMKYPRCGIMSPLIDGGVGNLIQQYPPIPAWKEREVEALIVDGTDVNSIPVCFPCVYIKRRLINDIGLLDENFVNYGFDDHDYCLRARRAGYWTMATQSIRIKHGAGGNHLQRGVNWSVSFAKEPEKPSNQEYFLRKYSK
jgi:GT2 family glycosyltransferase